MLSDVEPMLTARIRYRNNQLLALRDNALLPAFDCSWWSESGPVCIWKPSSELKKNFTKPWNGFKTVELSNKHTGKYKHQEWSAVGQPKSHPGHENGFTVPRFVWTSQIFVCWTILGKQIDFRLLMTCIFQISLQLRVQQSKSSCDREKLQG